MARKRDMSKTIKDEMNAVRYGPAMPKGKPGKMMPPAMKGKKKAC